MLVGICSASGSGKTTLANKIAKAVKRSPALNQDAYYLDRSNLCEEERAALNYDHPSSFDYNLLLKDVHKYQKKGLNETIGARIYRAERR